jgi:hypothetical protein
LYWTRKKRIASRFVLEVCVVARGRDQTLYPVTRGNNKMGLN